VAVKIETKRQIAKEKKMKKASILIVTMIVTLMISSGSYAVAGKFGNRHHGDAGYVFGGLGRLMHLDLTDLQKKQVYDIINKYRDDQKEARKNIMEARQQMESLAFSESFNENDFREAYQQRASIMEDLAVIKAKTFSEIKNVLTPEQIASLKERTGKKGKRMKHRARMKQCMMESWLQPDGE